MFVKYEANDVANKLTDLRQPGGGLRFGPPRGFAVALLLM